MTHLTASWGRIAGVLSLEDAISVSEQVMERAGLAGRTIHMPVGHVDDPVYQAAIAPWNEYVRQVTGQQWLRIYCSSYDIKVNGNPLAMTDGYNSIVVRETTNDMTVLHECAHVIRATPEGSGGHDRMFAGTARDLYSRWISPAAGEKFWEILSIGGYV